MGYAEIIALEAKKLPAEKQAEVLDFIVFLKARQRTVDAASVPKTAAEIEAFFRSFNVDARAYKFNRDDANAR
ncbi:MAG: hypothetical protein WCJ75_16230 [Desulfomonile sp.]|jgi:hypothetical protein